MFKAMGRYIGALFALMTGGINGMRESLNRNRHVIAATYDEIADDQIARIKSMSNAVAGMMTQKERKVTKAKTLTERVSDNSEMRDGALAMIDELKGQYDLSTDEGVAQLKGTEDYQQAAEAYSSLTKEIEDDENTIAELELSIAEDTENLAGHLTELGSMKDQIEKIKNEKHETIAAVEAAKAEKEINDMINGISQNDAGERLEEMRSMRNQIKSEVVVGRKLAGTDTKKRKDKFKQFARRKKSSSEFDNLLGIGKEKTESKEGTTEKVTTQLPE